MQSDIALSCFMLQGEWNVRLFWLVDVAGVCFSIASHHICFGCHVINDMPGYGVQHQRWLLFFIWRFSVQSCIGQHLAYLSVWAVRALSSEGTM